MLYEEHAINSARGFVRKYLPVLAPVVSIYERLSGKTFPKLRPKKRWYEHPIYYLGNHLTFVTSGAEIKIPEYTDELDYELELGVILCRPLKNASPEEAMKAVGGFVVLNDFSARDVQISEIQAGFGPMKSKNFANAVSNVVVSADEIWPVINELKVRVTINGRPVVENTTNGMYYTIAEAIAYASWEEQLHPGEFFGSGTIPTCCGIENGCFLNSGDVIELYIENIGSLTNSIK
ncbi:MAG: fumarylacetoacetate hydrolase family protein [Desulfatitalea sp.]|nr:fumarylacetoacetate hydrolase family protein [Desulfatitalea sp.]NNJ98888.1 fumarylacetoacetate hydrolase family protein [Desulfatitalea sp.]